MTKLVIGFVIVAALVLSLSVSIVLAQDACEGNFNCDQDVDGEDAAIFKEDFGRNKYENPCDTCLDSPCPCNPCPYNMIDCGTKCVDPMTDEDFCGVDSSCLGGIVCGASEKCVVGVCEVSCDPPAPVPKTGQTRSSATGDDGDLEEGVTWPHPRFMYNRDGTITDNLTGLIWLQNANCFGMRKWNDAISDANELASGLCGLTDGSSAGEWRLPNRLELESLLDLANYAPALPSVHAFLDVQNGYYWSSTTSNAVSDNRWGVNMSYGPVGLYHNLHYYYVWPVRGGQ